MISITGVMRGAAVFFLLAGVSSADWDERLAGAFSGRLKAIEAELETITPKLDQLPEIPVADQGGTGGFACIHPTAVPEKGVRYAVEIHWRKKARVDSVALVPARRYDARGVDAHYGLPESFTVELIDDHGETVSRVAHEPQARSNPARRGHPFVYSVSPTVEATGLRVVAERLHPDVEDEGMFVHAWAEAFVFEGDRNVTKGAEVRGIGGAAPPAPWHWSHGFLIDGQTPLGLPEIPAGEHRNVGWLSQGHTNPDQSVALIVDLGESKSFDHLRLLPAKRPTSDLPSGFGFPRELAVSVSESGDPADEVAWRDVSRQEFANPGHNPVIVPFPKTGGRFVKIEATKLWKEFEGYPAFFALSEVEVLMGERNLAEGRPVRSLDGMLNLIAPGGRYWSTAALSDGFGPDGRLVSAREWLTQLDERLKLETRRHELKAEAGRVLGAWRRAGWIGFAVLGLAGAFLIIVLPVRYRVHSKREMMKVRERIAGDLHDEVGSNLGSIQMFADLAEGRSGPSEELKRIQRIAAETVSAVRDIVWLLRPGGEHRIATVEHLRETSSIMLESLEWKFSANEPSWQVELPDEANRHLFLFFREALHNILRHARATNVEIRVETADDAVRLSITDDGCGISPERMARPATLRALRQRAEALGAEFHIESAPDKGTRLDLAVPRTKKGRKSRRPTKVSTTAS